MTPRRFDLRLAPRQTRRGPFLFNREHARDLGIARRPDLGTDRSDHFLCARVFLFGARQLITRSGYVALIRILETLLIGRAYARALFVIETHAERLRAATNKTKGDDKDLWLIQMTTSDTKLVG